MLHRVSGDLHAWYQVVNSGVCGMDNQQVPGTWYQYLVLPDFTGSWFGARRAEEESRLPGTWYKVLYYNLGYQKVALILLKLKI